MRGRMFVRYVLPEQLNSSNALKGRGRLTLIVPLFVHVLGASKIKYWGMTLRWTYNPLRVGEE